MKRIIDVCCGGRAFWFNKHNGDMWSKYDYIDNLLKEMVGEDK